MINGNVSAALSTYPELRRLIDLRLVGWAFLPVVVCGDVVQLNGFRVWNTGEVDAIRVLSPTDANGLRTLTDESGIVWERSGTVDDVVAGLLALPAPDEPHAPRLVRGAAPDLWTP